MLIKIIFFSYFFYERTSSYLKKMQSEIDRFHAYGRSKLTLWQYRALVATMAQGPRDILWYVDDRGNHGKTFFAKFLVVLYKFQYLTGDVSIIYETTG